MITNVQFGRASQVEYVRHMFDAYKHAMRTLAASYRSVPERRAAIQIRDEFEGGIEGHIGTLLDALAAQREPLAFLCEDYNCVTGQKVTPESVMAEVEKRKRVNYGA